MAKQNNGEIAHFERVRQAAVNILLAAEEDILGTDEGTEEGRWEWRAGVLRWRKDGVPFYPFTGENLIASVLHMSVESEEDITSSKLAKEDFEIEALVELWRASEGIGEPFFIGLAVQATDTGLQEEEAVTWLANQAMESAAQVEEEIADIEHAGDEVAREFEEGTEKLWRAQQAAALAQAEPLR